MISVENLTKCYGPRLALDRVSFQIERGEAIGLLGLNGAGKTTMLKILTSLILPSAGRATVDGLDVVKNARGVRARLGYLPDTPPIYGEMTVRSYLLFAAQLRGLVGREALERVEQVEEMTAIRDVRDERASHLSHGYRQRVGIAQAIVHRPSVVILDEPTSGLDPAQTVEMRGLIRSLRSEHTVLFSSHLLPEVSHVCDRVLILHRGALLGSPKMSELAAVLGMHTVLVRVRGEPKGLVELLSKLEGVHEVSVEQFNQGQTELRLMLAPDVRPQVARALIAQGYDLLRLDRPELDLETVFLRVTGHKSQGTRDANGSADRPA
ncbi:MAG TPA: ABC transporter ATP-binding protein [Myxococcaceae bacterium]|nr:ABC transporter ATP-binding protein [Myxococcaceae bacterium]